jgi:hypothetical protein
MPYPIRVAAVVAGLLLSVRVSAQATGARAAAETVADSVVATWPAALRDAVRAIVDSAAVGGLPVAPLRAKIAEGAAKNAEPALIVTVVRALLTNMDAARSALGTRMSEAELVAAAAALQTGVRSSQLQALKDRLRSGRSSTQLFVVVTDLTRRGVAVDETVRALQRLAEAGAGDAAFAQLRLDVAKDVTAGLAPRTAVRRNTDAYISRGFTPSGGIFPPPTSRDR